MNKGKWLLLSFLAAGLFSCSKSQLSCFIIRITENNQTAVEYQYTSNKLSRVNIYATAAPYGLDTYIEVVRTSNNQVDYTDKRNGSGLLTLRRKCVYNAQDQLVELIDILDNDNNGYPETFNGKVDFLYNADGMIDSVIAYNASYNVTESYGLVWTDGNITRVNRPADYLVFTYDDYDNIYYPVRWDYLAYSTDLTRLSVNNYTSVSYYDFGNNLQNTISITYTYDDDHHVPVSDSQGDGYEYSCN